MVKDGCQQLPGQVGLLPRPLNHSLGSGPVGALLNQLLWPSECHMLIGLGLSWDEIKLIGLE